MTFVRKAEFDIMVMHRVRTNGACGSGQGGGLAPGGQRPARVDRGGIAEAAPKLPGRSAILAAGRPSGQDEHLFGPKGVLSAGPAASVYGAKTDIPLMRCLVQRLEPAWTPPT